MAIFDRFFGVTRRLEIGRFIGGCEVREKLAAGPMSTVYLAVNAEQQKVVAKVLTPHGNRIAEKLTRKLGKPWEGERAKALTNPNIVHTFDCGKERGNYYIIMEFLPGGNLTEKLRSPDKLPLEQKLDIALGAANGLAYVHEKGIIHRDICSKNLMFDSKAAIKLIDFGVAINQYDQLRPTAVRTGRPSYQAPELIRYNRFNVQTDIYAFGVVLYELFAGQLPFIADSREDTIGMHLRAEPAPPAAVNPAVPGAVSAVVMKALAKIPQDRFMTMKELTTALIRLRSSVH